MPWTPTPDLKKPSKILSPYEDWDGVIQPGFLAAPTDKENWQPVYVKLKKPFVGVGGSASELIEILKKNVNKDDACIAAGDDTYNTLQILMNTKSDPKDALASRAYLFVYRPQSLAHDVKDVDGCYKVLRVGPAVPFAFVSRTGPRGVKKPQLHTVAKGPVVTGIIDDAIGVVHERLRHKDGTTRVAFFWKQGIPAVAAKEFIPLRAKTFGLDLVNLGVTQGVAFNGALIDWIFKDTGYDEAATYRRIEARQQAKQSAGVQYLPQTRRTMTQAASHGTFVADLAAGYPKEQAPDDRPIIAVELPALATADTSGARLEMFVLEALLRLIDWADNWPVQGGTNPKRRRVPVVVNLSYGFSAGPKDGTGFLETEIARHVAARNKAVRTAAVLVAGNDYRRRLRAEMKLEKGDNRAVDWRILPQDRTASFLEVRFPQGEGPVITIEVPNDPNGRIDLDFSGTKPVNRDYVLESRTTARVYVQDLNKMTVVTLAVRPTQNLEDPSAVAPAGKWRITVRNDRKKACNVVLDVQRDDAPRGFPRIGRQSYLEDEHYGAFDRKTRTYTNLGDGSSVTRLGTLSAIATKKAKEIYVVGGAVNVPNQEASLYTSSGPNGKKDGPNLAATAEDGYATPGALAAGTFSGSVFALGGTSAAAPRITRKVVEWVSNHKPARLPNEADLLGAAFLKKQDPRSGYGILPAAKEPGRRARRYGP
jgi:hypothetical protein